MKRWTPVEVLWSDAHGGDLGWASIKDSHRCPSGIRTVGQMEHYDDDGITIVLSRDLSSKNNDAYIFIPASGIVKVTELRKVP